ncbi:MAG: VanZ family protein [Lachnospiraceae bacterium]|nr:VanZ family protein [Lachnospiraceae bacterium]
MIIIFSFSARTSVESTNDSMTIGMTIGKYFVSGFTEMSADEQYAIAEKMEFPIRKSAHGLEYAMLGFLLTGAFYTCTWKKKNFFYPWILAVVYASSDEFHQLFVPGRSGQIRDVCIDAAGALVGVVIGILVWGKMLMPNSICYKDSIR